MDDYKTAIEQWQQRMGLLKFEPYAPHVTQWDDGGFITYFVNDERCRATQIDDKFTIFHNSNGDIVGVKLMFRPKTKLDRDLDYIRDNTKVISEPGAVLEVKTCPMPPK